jgi:uncharacterized membrane-anchored protein
MRRWIFGLATVAVLVAMNLMIVQKEAVLRSGTRMYLRLAPRDPRSLMQGDYMELAYEMTNPFRHDPPRPDGCLVVTLDAGGIATFVRFHDGTPPGAEERLLRYRSRGQVRLGAESFFFQEGQADRYANARYGELRVTPSGDSVLVGLADEKLHHLGPR